MLGMLTGVGGDGDGGDVVWGVGVKAIGSTPV